LLPTLIENHCEQSMRVCVFGIPGEDLARGCFGFVKPV
jgi:hypothetical protein